MSDRAVSEPSTPRTSRSAIIARQECPRLRLTAYDLDGHGYSTAGGSVALVSGIAIHEGFAALLDPINPASLDASIAIMLDSYQEAAEKGLRQADAGDLDRTILEQKFMLEGMLRGWVKIRMENFLNEYEVVSVERAWTWQLGPDVILPFRMDAIVRRKADGRLHIVDFKGTGTDNAMWAETFEYSVQTILYITGLEEHTGEPVGGMSYEGLVRGQFRKDTAKSSPFFETRIQGTPFCYAYRKLEPDGSYIYRPDYTAAKGWGKFAVWEVFTAAQWVDLLEQWGVLQDQFVAGTPLNPSPRIRQSIRRQIAHQERQWLQDVDSFHTLRDALGLDHPEVQELLEKFAPQITGRCTKFGADHRCGFYQGGACFAPDFLTVIRDDAAFMPRVSHHPGQEAD